MHLTEDLRITQEILPLFDFTLNPHAKKRLELLLSTPLNSVDAIEERQQIIAGFYRNKAVLGRFSYSTVYFATAYNFLERKEELSEMPQNLLKYKARYSSYTREKYKSDFMQLVLLLKRIDIFFLSEMTFAFYPEKYAKTIKEMISFMRLIHSNEHIHQDIDNKSLKDIQVLKLNRLLLKHWQAFEQFWESFLLFEVYYSISVAIEKHNYCFPKVSEGNRLLHLEEFYHPLLSSPIKNTLQTESSVLILNGPNMSGKSTLLKAIGICVFLSHLGLAVPANKASIPFFSNFSIVINHRDNLQSGYSHFMNELHHLKNIAQLAQQKERCFAVFDELFNGTNPTDAHAILQLTIKGLSNYRDSLFLMSTHLEGIKDFDENNISNYYIECKLINDTPTFTYCLKEGWSDIKIGQILFEKEGLHELLRT